MTTNSSVRLFRALFNLVSNAVEAASKHKHGLIEIAAEKTRRGVNIDIIDNGPGLPPNVVDRFQKAIPWRSHPGNLHGLGLMIAERMIDELGGSLHLVQTCPRGSHFQLFLPDYPAEPETLGPILHLATVHGQYLHE